MSILSEFVKNAYRPYHYTSTIWSKLEPMRRFYYDVTRDPTTINNDESCLLCNTVIRANGRFSSINEDNKYDLIHHVCKACEFVLNRTTSHFLNDKCVIFGKCVVIPRLNYVFDMTRIQLWATCEDQSFVIKRNFKFLIRKFRMLVNMYNAMDIIRQIMNYFALVAGLSNKKFNNDWMLCNRILYKQSTSIQTNIRINTYMGTIDVPKRWIR